MKRILFLPLICLLFAVHASAQSPLRGVTAAAGGGFSFPVGDIKTHTETGFNFFASGGPRFNPHFALTVDFTLHYMELKNSFEDHANNVSLSGGSLHRIWSLTLNPVYDFIKKERFSSYASGGYGLYNRKLLLAAPGLTPVTICDEFWNVCIDNRPGPTVTGDLSLYKGGFNAGGGINFGTRRKFFIDARYHHMFTGDSPTEIIPVTFGVRW
jgi:opacity protein-like surface antigen